MDGDNSEKIIEFLSITGVEDVEFAEGMLKERGWNVQAAVEHFFAAPGEAPPPSADPPPLSPPLRGTSPVIPPEGGANVGMLSEEEQLRRVMGESVAMADEDEQLQRIIAMTGGQGGHFPDTGRGGGGIGGGPGGGGSGDPFGRG
eukprot:CAMPEP_0181299196 /NCGR_PEP_ID=MMETSP1101-20121128/6209_1 /TAXON_ID=46948 /ORGANISM="Rhodomonas abbreviata, Strain Caron Lab Isolate" /LENGTH=144 /DNA_ID=CAMNT_0023404313 /DNA_START=469 /DNA_END=899 /DNA_ORIENTATION=-